MARLERTDDISQLRVAVFLVSNQSGLADGERITASGDEFARKRMSDAALPVGPAYGSQICRGESSCRNQNVMIS
jgi:hypothetical protein